MICILKEQVFICDFSFEIFSISFVFIVHTSNKDKKMLQFRETPAQKNRVADLICSSPHIVLLSFA